MLPLLDPEDAMHAARTPAWAGAALLLSLTACADAAGPAAPIADGAPAFSSTGRQILMLDACDPASFNAAVGPGTCVRPGGMSFQQFVTQLGRHRTVPAWRFSPDVIHVAAEVTLPIVNLGGEVHTFTEVAEFGPGIVPPLNALMGLTGPPVPECLGLGPSDFVPAGGWTTHTFEPGESAKYMCCIHPWMRAVTR